MAFPTIPTVGAGRLLSNFQADGSATRTFPSLSGLTKNSGDLLIAICVVYQSSAASGAVFSGWGGGFTELTDQGGTTSNLSIGVATKISTGSETGTFTVTQAATVTGQAAMFLMSIPGAHASSGPIAGSIIHNTAAAANINAVTPSWGALDTLWIAVAGNGETSTTGTFTGIASAPTNYTGYLATGSNDVTGAVEAAVAFRQLNTATEDPATFSVDISNARNSALLLAVRPASNLVTIAQAQETDSAQALSATVVHNTYNITRATETDSVGTIVPFQPLPAATTASAQPISTQSGHGITTAATTASAQALDVDKKVTITPAAETDSAISRNKIITFVSETDSARPLTSAHNTFTLTPVTETDLAGDIITFQPLPALTTDSPQVLTFSQSGRVLTPATTTASAQVLGFTQAGGRHLTAATETDLANTIVRLQPFPASTTTTVFPLEIIHGGRNIAPAFESDSARSIAAGAGVSLPEWEMSAPIPYNNQPAVGDRSTAVALSVSFGAGAHKSITPATETNTAQALTVHKAATLTLVTDTSAVQALSKHKTYSITTATTTALALNLVYTQGTSVFHLITPAVSTDTGTALSITKTHFMDLGIVSTTMIARLTRAANRPSGGLALIDHDPGGGLILIDHTGLDDLALIDI